MFFILLLFSVASFAQTKASFFPRFPMGRVIEERILDKQKIERSLERQGETYRYVVNFESLGKISSAVAYPILKLSQYSTCSTSATQPLQVSTHYEPIWMDSHFKCDSPPDYDPVKLRDKMKIYCVDSALMSEAQKVLCKELNLK